MEMKCNNGALNICPSKATDLMLLLISCQVTQTQPQLFKLYSFILIASSPLLFLYCYITIILFLGQVKLANGENVINRLHHVEVLLIQRGSYYYPHDPAWMEKKLFKKICHNCRMHKIMMLMLYSCQKRFRQSLNLNKWSLLYFLNKM